MCRTWSKDASFRFLDSMVWMLQTPNSFVRGITHEGVVVGSLVAIAKSGPTPCIKRVSIIESEPAAPSFWSVSLMLFLSLDRREFMKCRLQKFSWGVVIDNGPPVGPPLPSA